MRKFIITDGLFKQVQQRLLKVVQQNYHADGLYLALDGINIKSWDDDDYSIEYQVRWGKMVDGKCEFQYEATIWAGDGNLDFLAGQFYEKMIAFD